MTRKLFSIFILFSFLFLTIAQAQEVDLDKVFREFEQKQQQEFNMFKNKADEEFSAFLRETWEKFDSSEPIPAPERPEPVSPTVFTEEKDTTPPVQVKPKKRIPTLPVSKGVTPDKPYIPVKIEKLPVASGKPVRRTPIRFYGTAIYISTNVIEEFSLSSINEADIATAWSQLCKADHEQFINDCMTLREEKQLSDWAYLLFTKEIGSQLFGSRRTDDIAFIQMFILSKSGYKARLSRINDQLKLLVPVSGVLYGLPYITLSGTRYYVFEPAKQSGKSVYTYPQEFANARNYINLLITSIPDLEQVVYTHTYCPKGEPFSVQTVVNKNLIDFYKDYPQCDVVIRHKAPISSELRLSLYPSLEKSIQGKSQKEAANILIHFVQTAFDYKTDGEQFGYEKPNFLEENFFYPYNDCEDRAILYCRLVKDLLGLDTVLLDYPNHIASAVHFTEEISGDYVLIDEKKYLICDPTYIGAPVGKCMDEYKRMAPEVIR